MLGPHGYGSIQVRVGFVLDGRSYLASGQVHVAHRDCSRKRATVAQDQSLVQTCQANAASIPRHPASPYRLDEKRKLGIDDGCRNLPQIPPRPLLPLHSAPKGLCSCKAMPECLVQVTLPT